MGPGRQGAKGGGLLGSRFTLDPRPSSQKGPPTGPNSWVHAAPRTAQAGVPGAGGGEHKHWPGGQPASGEPAPAGSGPDSISRTPPGL